MTKTLLLLRHAKSDWGDPALDDHDRPLNKRGERAATLMGRHLEDESRSIERVLCSSARRTRETLERLGDRLTGCPRVDVERSLYLASAEDLFEHLARLDDAIESVLVIAHNPGIAHLAQILAGRGDEEVLGRMRRKYPTGALARLSLAVESWAELGPGCGRLESFTTPRSLDATATDRDATAQGR